MKNDLILRLEVESDNTSWTVHVDQVALEIGDEWLSRLGPPVGPRAETGKVELHRSYTEREKITSSSYLTKYHYLCVFLSQFLVHRKADARKIMKWHKFCLKKGVMLQTEFLNLIQIEFS